MKQLKKRRVVNEDSEKRLRKGRGKQKEGSEKKDK